MRDCHRCKVDKPEEDFYQRHWHRNDHWCIECHKEYAKEYAKKKKESKLNYAANIQN